MKALSMIRSLIVACLVFAAVPIALADSEDTANTPQAGFSAIVVNGRTLTGPNTAAQLRNGRMMIPVASVARALGDTFSIDSMIRSVTVNRMTGVASTFDARTGQVRENGAVILSVTNSGSIGFPPNPDEMMLPVEIASAVFGASIRFEAVQNRVLIDRGITAAGSTVGINRRRLLELYQADYEYNLNRYSTSLSQSLVINATGRLADGRFYLNSNSNGGSYGPFSPQQFSFHLERPNGQRFIAGDFGSGTILPLLTTNIRGGLATIPVGQISVTAFGGKANSGIYLPAVFSDNPFFIPPVQKRPRYDTNVFGFFVSNNSSPRAAANGLTLSAGAMRFSGIGRSGELATASATYMGTQLRFQADFGAGKFKRSGIDGRTVEGFDSAVDIAGTYQIAENLSVQGRYAHIGRNFLSPQTGVHDPIDLKAAGVAWSPVKWLTASVNASTSKRPGELGRAESYVTTAFSVTPGGAKPRFYFSHTASSSKLYTGGAFTLFNASKDFQRWRLYVNATRVKNIGPATINAQVGANISINDSNSLEVNQGIGSRNSLNGMIDWRTSGLAGNRLSLTAGMGYNYTQNSRFAVYEKLTAGLALPRQSSLQVSYINQIGGPTLLVQLRGTIFRKKEASTYLNALPSEVNNFGSVSGRVYQDVDGNGRFDVGVDKPQAAVKVRVDGNRYVETDENGIFRFDAIVAGGHRVYIDLVSVRADLTLLDSDSRDVTLGGGKDTAMDFRLVRTGRITGRVFLDANRNGKLDDGETPLGDIRIVTGSGRDTLTDADGYFTIGDLAPGEHVVLIDEKTLPEKTIVGTKPLAVQVFGGRETNDIILTVIARPAEVKRFGQNGGQ